MNRFLGFAAVASLAACQQAPLAAPAATGGAQRDLLAGTSWSFTVPTAGEIVATFAPGGHYYDLNNGKIVESGTYATVDGQVCEDLDATPDNDHVCWTMPSTLPPVGGTLETTSNKGQTVKATRIDYRGTAPAGGNS
jgi:hypothetical protein